MPPPIGLQIVAPEKAATEDRSRGRNFPEPRLEPLVADDILQTVGRPQILYGILAHLLADECLDLAGHILERQRLLKVNRLSQELQQSVDGKSRCCFGQLALGCPQLELTIGSFLSGVEP